MNRRSLFCASNPSNQQRGPNARAPGDLSRADREKGAGMYWPALYALADVIAELPYLFVMCAVSVNVVYWGVGFANNAFAFAYFWALSFVYLCMMTYMGLLLSAAMPDQLSAQLFAAAFFGVMNAFSGVGCQRARAIFFQHGD